MADDTIVEEPTGQSGQVENPPNEPESAGDGEYVPSSTGTIAMRTDSHSDQVDKAVDDIILKGKEWFDSLSSTEKLDVYYELLDKGIL